ncbi:hypothetical protein [Trabulsiella odontotermitis]|uniref:hypothetical protein n=1 Tax=Trabulsiella odontotermitis TaxID=379893 RepID=UPI000675EBD5|nr:hypothetical protein [Trabulsiella odontotermitis]
MIADMVTITLCALAAFPAYVGVVSFIVWENGFRKFGAGFICRTAIFIVAAAWVLYLLPGGAK